MIRFPRKSMRRSSHPGLPRAEPDPGFRFRDRHAYIEPVNRTLKSDLIIVRKKGKRYLVDVRAPKHKPKQHARPKDGSVRNDENNDFKDGKSSRQSSQAGGDELERNGEAEKRQKVNNSSTVSLELNNKALKREIEELATVRGLKINLVFVKHNNYSDGYYY